MNEQYPLFADILTSSWLTVPVSSPPWHSPLFWHVSSAGIKVGQWQIIVSWEPCLLWLDNRAVSSTSALYIPSSERCPAASIDVDGVHLVLKNHEYFGWVTPDRVTPDPISVQINWTEPIGLRKWVQDSFKLPLAMVEYSHQGNWWYL